MDTRCRRGWRRPRWGAVLLLGLLLASPLVAGAPRAADRERLDALFAAARERGVVSAVESGEVSGRAALEFPDLRRRVDSVEDLPLPVLVGRKLGTAGVEVEEDEAPDDVEAGTILADLAAPATHERWAAWSAYVRGRGPDPGARILARALTLRRRARVLKLRRWVEERLGRPWVELSEADVGPLREEDPAFAELVEDVFEPVVFVFWEADEEGGSGPSHASYPIVVLARAGAIEGKGEHRGIATDAEGSFLAWRCDSVVELQSSSFDLDERIAEDALAGVLAHELFHGIQYDLEGAAMHAPNELSSNGHDAPVVSDRFLAFTEGWAELAEAWFGEGDAAYDNSRGEAPVEGWELGRQDPIRRNRYLNEDYEKFDATDSARRRSRIKTGTQMIANEGLVAGVLFQLLTHRKLRDPMGLMLRTLYEAKPHTLTEMVEGMAARAPDRRQAAIVRLTFLHATRFATVSAEARRRFQEADGAHLAWLRAKNGDREGPALEALARAREEAQARYRDLTLGLAKRVEAGELALDAAVGPELWFEGVDEDGDGFRFDLNTAQWWELRRAGLSEEGREALLEARDRAEAGFQGVGELASVLPGPDHARLVELRERFLESSPDHREASGAE